MKNNISETLEIIVIYYDDLSAKRYGLFAFECGGFFFLLLLVPRFIPTLLPPVRIYESLGGFTRGSTLAVIKHSLFLSIPDYGVFTSFSPKRKREEGRGQKSSIRVYYVGITRLLRQKMTETS